MKKRIIILSALILSLLILSVSACGKAKESAKLVDPSLYERDATENDPVYEKTHAVYDGSYRSMLTKDERKIYDAIEQAVIGEDKTVISLDISEMGFLSAEAEQLSNLVNMAGYAFFEDHPEIFWIRQPYFEASKLGQHNKKVQMTLLPSYPHARDQREIVQAGMDAAVREISAKRASGSRYDTVKAIHDYVCLHLEYHYGEADESDGSQQTCAPIFGGGGQGYEAVCEGYARSFKTLCDKFDIPCALIGSTGHAYNYVQMEDGCYYAVDCTWDDEGGSSIGYTYFLNGSETVLGSSSDSVFTFLDEYMHSEYWYLIQNFVDARPFVYPTLSEKAYQPGASIELLGDEGKQGAVLSGIVTLKFRYNGSDAKGKTAKIVFSNQTIATPKIDENGCFETTIDTTLYYNGYMFHTLIVTVGDSSLRQELCIQNRQLEILDWGDEVPSVTGPYTVRVKGYSTGHITDCKAVVRLDAWESSYESWEKSFLYGSFAFDKDGVATFTLDPKKTGEGLHSFAVYLQRPGAKYRGGEFNMSQFYSFRVSATAPDSGKLRFWGHSASPDRNVGEWADFTLKYDGVVTDQCQFDVTVDGSPVKPLRQGGDKVTDFFDKDGYGAFWLDVNGLSDGPHTLSATLTTADGSTVFAENTVNTTGGYFDYELWQYKTNEGLVRYTDSSQFMEGFFHAKIYNRTGEPGDQCRFMEYLDNDIVSDKMMTIGLDYLFWNEGEPFEWEYTAPHISYGDHVMKMVFRSSDGTLVEKSLPFRLKPDSNVNDVLHFAVNSTDEVRSVGHTADFTVKCGNPYFTCRELRVFVDDKPADVAIPDDPAAAFDYFRRFSFTLDFPEDQAGAHTVKAVLTMNNGGMLIAEQKIDVTDDCFEVLNWPGENPTLHRVYDVKVRRTVDTGEPATIQFQSSVVRQFIDGEYMGCADLDGKDGTGTLALNTAGLGKGEHLYKLVFCYNKGKTVERIMRFRVE